MNTSFLGHLGRLVNSAPYLLKPQYASRLQLQVNRFICTSNTSFCNKTPNNNSAGTKVEGSSNINVTYEELKEHLSSGLTTVIDVRQPEELMNNCYIPGTINIPLYMLPETLNLPTETFEYLFGQKKPQNEDLIIFSCKMGVRSEKAVKLAELKGFKNTRNYVGGWVEWQEKSQLK